jgi:TetR/AcrR family transcriptional regulator
MPRPRRTAPPDSRARIFDAAAAEFAARGFAGAGIDHIARRARLNKAMIYYHFDSKQALYREILREMYRAVGLRLQGIVASPTTPEAKLAEFLTTIVEEAERRPYFPAIMLREIAEGAPRLDPETLGLISGLFQSVTSIVKDGERHGAFGALHPLVAYFALVAPTVFFLASRPARQHMHDLKPNAFMLLEPSDFIASLHRFALRGLRKD